MAPFLRIFVGRLPVLCKERVCECECFVCFVGVGVGVGGGGWKEEEEGFIFLAEGDLLYVKKRLEKEGEVKM